MIHAGSKVEYVIQGRVQDYWLDCWNDKFQYLNEAQEVHKLIQQANPTLDYRIVKRITTYEEEPCCSSPEDPLR